MASSESSESFARPEGGAAPGALAMPTAGGDGSGLIADGVCKAYGALAANDDVHLHVAPGEVHALLGENGAGKSTLVGILTGRLEPDSGRVILNGEQLEVGSTRASAEHGITAVYQDLMLVPSMTGLENIALALHAAPNASTRRRILEIEKRFDLQAILDVPVERLEAPARQRIELTRALCQRPSVLLLDEPTSLLPPLSVETFLEQVRRLADEGLAVLLITHRLEEARSISDRVSVLRRGQIVARFERQAMPSNTELALAMVGSRVIEPQQATVPAERIVLRAESLSVTGTEGTTAVLDVSLGVREGEILGIAGVDGNGQQELLEALAGLRRPHDGAILLDDDDLGHRSYADRLEDGILFVSGERRAHGVVPTLSVREHFEIVAGRQPEGNVADVLGRYDVQPADPGVRADALSGGNQQKMILARAFNRTSRVVLLAYPTQGLDVQAAARVHQILVGEAGAGTALVVASSDLDELLLIAHRIVVMSRGRIVGQQSRAEFDGHRLAEWITA